MAMPIRERRNLQNAYQVNNSAAENFEPVPVRRERSGATRSRVTAAQKAQEEARKQQERAELIAALEMKRNELIERLDRGAARIEEARAQGKNVNDWEDYWIQLLRNYEKVCDQLAEMSGNF